MSRSVYLFIYYLFIYYLFIYLFIYGYILVFLEPKWISITKSTKNEK